MNIEDFQQLASASFPSDAAINVITSIEMSRLSGTPRFRIVVSGPNGAAYWGESSNAQDSINDCKRRQAEEHEAQLAAARKLLGIEE